MTDVVPGVAAIAMYGPHTTSCMAIASSLAAGSVAVWVPVALALVMAPIAIRMVRKVGRAHGLWGNMKGVVSRVRTILSRRASAPIVVVEML